MTGSLSDPTHRAKVGLAVVFAALGDVEEAAIRAAWQAAKGVAQAWEPAFFAVGLDPIPPDVDADILVYLGESSRFAAVAGAASLRVPVLFVKSTIESLLDRPAGSAKRYRMSTGVDGIAAALANAAPLAPTVDWRRLPWPETIRDLLTLDPDEDRYVANSVAGFRAAAEGRGIPWMEGQPAGGAPFSVFLTMHDPTAARLAETALACWPQCTVLAADGMVALHAPSGQPWPPRLIRVRHWSAVANSASNRRYREALGNGAASSDALPDIDSPGMLFGTLHFLEQALAEGGDLGYLELAGAHQGPLGPMQMRASGRPDPERLILFRGQEMTVSTLE